MTTDERGVDTSAPYTDATRARLLFAAEAAELADLARVQVPIRSSELLPDGGAVFVAERIRAAVQLAAQGQRVLEDAVVYGRTAGVSWDHIGSALGTSRQAAHGRFAGAANAFHDALASAERTPCASATGCRLPPAASDPLGAAADLDAWVVRHRELLDGDPAPDPVSRGLVRMDIDTELVALSDQRRALFVQDPLPRADQLLPIAERELVLWEGLTTDAAPGDVAHSAVRLTRDTIAYLRECLARNARLQEQSSNLMSPHRPRLVPETEEFVDLVRQVLQLLEHLDVLSSPHPDADPWVFPPPLADSVALTALLRVHARLESTLGCFRDPARPSQRRILAPDGHHEHMPVHVVHVNPADLEALALTVQVVRDAPPGSHLAAALQERTLAPDGALLPLARLLAVLDAAPDDDTTAMLHAIASWPADADLVLTDSQEAAYQRLATRFNRLVVDGHEEVV